MTALAFLHGLGGGHAIWDAPLRRFASLGYRCIAWDQPGYGGRPLVEPYTLPTVTAALAEDLHAEWPVVLVGHSMGGFIAQEFHARYPERVRALVLAFTTASFGGSGPMARKFVTDRLGALDAGESMQSLAERLMPAMRGRRSAPGALERAQSIMAAIPPQTYRKAVELVTTFDRRADLRRIAVPTLLLAGSDDRTAPPSLMALMSARIPGAELAVLEGCGHLGPLDQPAEFTACMEQFLLKHGI